MTPQKRILAVDYGEKRIGLAITDPLKLFGYALETIKNDNRFWSNFIKLINQFDIEKIIIGYPLKESGEKTIISGKVERFAKELEQKLKVPIEFVDERYTSEIAFEKILESTPSKKKRREKGLIDKNAAAVMLQEYLRTESKN